MRRCLEDPLLAGGPLLVALAAAVSPVAGALALVAIVAVAARWMLPRRRRRSGAPVVVLTRLEPRRPRPRVQVSVAAVAGAGPGVRALCPAELHGGRVRRATARRRAADPALRAACLHVATRANARLTDAAAVRLGLADALVAPVASDPDPLLLAAAWAD